MTGLLIVYFFRLAANGPASCFGRFCNSAAGCFRTFDYGLSGCFSCFANGLSGGSARCSNGVCGIGNAGFGFIANPFNVLSGFFFTGRTDSSLVSLCKCSGG